MSDKYELVCKDTLIMRLEYEEAERDALQARIKQLEAELEEERQENASLRSGDDYERGAE
jgi:cell division protein FtsB